MQDRIFYTVCFGFILGVLLRSFVFVNFHTALLVGVLFSSIVLFLTFLSKNHSTSTDSAMAESVEMKWGIALCIFIFTFSLGVLRFHFSDKPAPYFFESQVGMKAIFSGKIIDEPNIAENNQKLVVEVKNSVEKTKILLTTSLDDEFKYGDKVDFSGKLEKPDNFITDTGKEFDYENYLKKDGIFYRMYFPKIEVVSQGNGNFIKSTLFSFKEKFLEKINLSIREPESLLMGGLILGEKSAFSEDLRKSFVDTGTIHIVALSGYNVSLVADWIMKLFSFLPFYASIGAGMLAIILFVLMAGASSTAVRAGIMAVLALFARATGRNYDAGRILLIAGVVMVLANPRILAFDVSFQLSFMATFAMIFFTPKIEKYFLWVTPKLKLREIFSVTTSVYLFVLPFIIYKMGNLSLVALPANFLILPFIPSTMILGFITGFAGLIWHPLSVVPGFLSQLLLSYELAIVNFFSNIPFASLSIPDFPLLITLAIYGYFIYRIFGRSIKSFFTEPF